MVAGSDRTVPPSCSRNERDCGIPQLPLVSFARTYTRCSPNDNSDTSISSSIFTESEEVKLKVSPVPTPSSTSKKYSIVVMVAGSDRIVPPSCRRNERDCGIPQLPFSSLARTYTRCSPSDNSDTSISSSLFTES